jgi:hypothetical protein
MKEWRRQLNRSRYMLNGSRDEREKAAELADL